MWNILNMYSFVNHGAPRQMRGGPWKSMALLVLLVGWGCIINLAHPASRSGKAWILTEKKLEGLLTICRHCRGTQLGWQWDLESTIFLYSDTVTALHSTSRVWNQTNVHNSKVGIQIMRASLRNRETGGKKEIAGLSQQSCRPCLLCLLWMGPLWM